MVAIMFTDIQGYTALMQRSEAKAIQVRNKHRRVFNDLTEKYRGQIINYYGDGTLSVFNSAVDAVRCGYELQIQFLESPAIPVRIGIHMGDIILSKEDVIGNSVNIASRVESLAIAGSVLFSEKVKEEISNHEDLSYQFVGSYHFKNDLKPRRIYALDKNGIETPAFGSLRGKTMAISDQEMAGKKVPQIFNPFEWLRKYRSFLLAGSAVLVLGLLVFRFLEQRKGRNWALNVALPEIEQLWEQRDYRSAFLMARQARRYVKNDVNLELLSTKVKQNLDLLTDPPGTSVYRKTYDAPEDQWELLGRTPIYDCSTYVGPSLWKFEKEGYREHIILANYRFGDSVFIKMDKLGAIPADMVRIKGRKAPLSILGVKVEDPVLVKDFLIDRYEVSNAAFQAFVDTGGYANPAYWKIPFIREGDTLSFAEATSLFLDKTGKNGPAEWELGEYPEGMDRYPVNGISMYEANAYATFAGKALPTVFHWSLASGIQFSNLVTPNSNIQKRNLAQAGAYPGISSSGVYDMAGNIREWCWNADESGASRFILGGSWQDPGYAFYESAILDPFDRSAANGFRCIQYLENDASQDALLKNIAFGMDEFMIGEPVSDEVFALFERQFNFDKTSFNTIAEPMESLHSQCNYQKVIVDAAYGEERMAIHLYFPTNVSPPYQTVVFFPGSGALRTPHFDPVHNPMLNVIDFVLKSGRAFAFPELKSTYDRQDEVKDTRPNKSVKYKEYVIMWTKDIIRTVDYLTTREDIDADRLAYHGFSWGGRLSSIVLAIEPRFKAAVVIAGLTPYLPLEEVAEYNYLPRVKVPILMLNGRHDSCCYPVETSQIPFFNLLGAAPEDKKHLIFEDAAHLPSRADMIKASLDWHDKYLGAVALETLRD